MQLNMKVDPVRVGLVLGIVFAALLSVGSLAMFAAGDAGPGPIREVTRVFHIDREGNLPALIQSMTLLACGGVLALIAIGARQNREAGARLWAVLAGIFVYLAIDEGAGIHELSGMLVDRLIEPSGIFRFSWVVVALVALTAFGIAFARFTWRLPVSTRWRFALAGILYVGGAVGIEMIAGLYIDQTRAWRSPIYYGLTTLEESLEAAGMTVMLVASMLHLRDHLRFNVLKLDWPGGSNAPVAIVRDAVPPAEPVPVAAEMAGS